MGLNFKEKLGRIFAHLIYLKNKKWIKNPIRYQAKTFYYLVRKGSNTSFGRDHFFDNIKTYDDFKDNVPIKDYEDIKPYIDKFFLDKLMFFGLGNQFILLKRAGQLQDSSISL